MRLVITSVVILARHVRLVALTSTVAFLASCGGGDSGRTPTEPTPPPVQPTVPVAVPGTLVVRLVTPNTDDGAIVLEITGPAPAAELAAAAPGALVHIRANGNTARVAVFGELGAGTLLRFNVPDVNAAPQYGAQVIEVADRASALRTGVTGYQLTIAP
jgi:hypothetical protein